MTSRQRVVYTILLLACTALTVSCGDSPASPENDFPTTPIALDVGNQDGIIDDVGFFNSAEDHFAVGAGGDQEPQGLIYEITVTNELDEPVSGLIVESEVSPHIGNIACRGILDESPFGATNPSSGMVGGGDCTPDGLRWEVGTLDGGETAILYFRAEALAQGDEVHRITVSADGLESEFVIEEPTLVGGAGSPLSLGVEDGSIGPPGVFDSAVSVHTVGDGGASAPLALIYAIEVTNQGAFPATGIEVSGRIPRTRFGAGLRCREILITAPDGSDNPTIGSASCTTEGLSWTVGTLDGGETAQLFVRVEALAPGNHVTRVTYSADQLSRAVVREELTPVISLPSP